jgi:hypothetical protein
MSPDLARLIQARKRTGQPVSGKLVANYLKGKTAHLEALLLKAAKPSYDSVKDSARNKGGI